MENPELPDGIIQHIQSFLETREAARTILVSKSWLRAWSTRPFLDFNVDQLMAHNSFSCDFIDHTLERYVERGLLISKFRLHLCFIQERWFKMLRRSNVIEIDLLLTEYSDRTNSVFNQIFLTQSLQVLRFASECWRVVLCPSTINCHNLRELEFVNLHIRDVTFFNIMSSCPLIEELLLTNCILRDSRASELGSPSFMFAGEYESLKRLSLVETDIDNKLLHSILSLSPQLEDFNLSDWIDNPFNPFNLSSVSLKRINICNCCANLILIDAPNLLELMYTTRTYWTKYFPVSILSPTTNGTVKVSIVYFDGHFAESWLYGLREFLSKFAKSNVQFTSSTDDPLCFDSEALRVAPLPPSSQVETLRFKERSFERYDDLPLMYVFFTICHPKIVVLDRPDNMHMPKLLTELLKALRYRGNLECCNLEQNKCWRHYIKDAKLNYVIDNEEKPLDVNGLKTGLGHMEAIILVLEWDNSY